MLFRSTQLPFPVERVTAGSLADEALRVRTARADAHQYVKGTIPAFLRYADGGRGISMRQCTSDFKIAPILRAMRPTRGNTVVQWIGISLDEAHRMKPARDSWLTSRWPLIEQRMTRNDCLRWLEARGYPRPPRSACVFCPFHNDAEWREMRDADPDGFARAVAFDAQYRATMATIPSHRGEAYLHHSLVPLSEVRFAADYQTNLFGNECEGVCGV